MTLSGRANVAALFAILFGTVYLLLLDPPFIVGVIFVFLCIAWAAWSFGAVFWGSDEVESAKVRYALAFASGIGVAFSIAFVLLMNAVPAVQNAITSMATSDGNELSSAAAGFGLGVAFTVLVLCAALCVGLTVWWASKR